MCVRGENVGGRKLSKDATKRKEKRGNVQVCARGDPQRSKARSIQG